MRVNISDYLKEIVSTLPEGVRPKKFRPSPKVKPPRRRPGLKNKSDQQDYMKNYMKQYREDGKDYQKVPDSVKEWRREQKKQIETTQKESDADSNKMDSHCKECKGIKDTNCKNFQYRFCPFYAINRLDEALGLGPNFIPAESKKYTCPNCGKHNAYYKEIHPDTDMNDIVLKCPDCGFIDE